MKNIGGLNKFSAEANLTLSQHFLEKKTKKNVHSFLQGHYGIEQNDRKMNKYKIKTNEGMKKRKSLVQTVSCL